MKRIADQKGVYEEFSTAIVDAANREAGKDAVFCLEWMEFRLSVVRDVRGKGYLFQVMNEDGVATKSLRWDSNMIGALNAASVFWSAMTYSKECLNGTDAPPFFEHHHFNIIWKDTVVLRIYKAKVEKEVVKTIADMIFNSPFSSDN